MSSKLPPGGYKQKAAWSKASSSHETQESELVNFLIQEWSWGNLSTPVIQRIASAAVKDGLTHPDLQKIANLGTSGLYPNHMSQELMNKLKPSKINGALSVLDVEYQARHIMQHVLLPHEMFATLYKHHRDVFTEQILGGSVTNIKTFW